MKRWDVIPSGTDKPRAVVIATRNKAALLWDLVAKRPMWPAVLAAWDDPFQTAPTEMRAEVERDVEAWFREHRVVAPGRLWLLPEAELFEMFERFAAAVMATEGVN
jgi:hypothetical protein